MGGYMIDSNSIFSGHGGGVAGGGGGGGAGGSAGTQLPGGALNRWTLFRIDLGALTGQSCWREAAQARCMCAL